MPHDADLFARHRAILCHFDSYSTALLFARWPDGSLLWPGPLTDSLPAAHAEKPSTAEGETVRQTVIARLGLNPADLVRETAFDEGLVAGDTAVRVHLLRFTTPDAPPQAIEPAGGTFRHLTALRGSAPSELALLRVVFNLLVGGGGRA